LQANKAKISRISVKMDFRSKFNTFENPMINFKNSEMFVIDSYQNSIKNPKILKNSPTNPTTNLKAKRNGQKIFKPNFLSHSHFQ
jgi:hypothetical protein